MKIKSVSMMFVAGVIFVAMTGPAYSDVFWGGGVSEDWSDASNWSGGLPSAGGAGNAIINQGSPNITPVVSTTGNTTVGEIYISIGAGLSVVDGGELTTINLITGLWGGSSSLSVSGGDLSITGTLNLGAGGYDGDVSISGGAVTAANLSINSSGGATMDISGSGSFIAPISNLGNINYWIDNGIITANGAAEGWFVNVDTGSSSGNVVLSAVPEPTTISLMALVAGGAFIARRMRI